MVYQCLSFWFCGNPNCTPIIWAWFIQPLEMVTIHHWKKPDRNILQPSYSCWSCGFVWNFKGQSLNPQVYLFFLYIKIVILTYTPFFRQTHLETWTCGYFLWSFAEGTGRTCLTCLNLFWGSDHHPGTFSSVGKWSEWWLGNCSASSVFVCSSLKFLKFSF